MLPPGPDWFNQGLRKPRQLQGETGVPQGKHFPKASGHSYIWSAFESDLI